MKNVDLQKIIYMNTLIAHRRTGTPEVFAQKLNLSRSALFEYLTFLRKDLMLEILYSCYSQTYYYGLRALVLENDSQISRKEILRATTARTIIHTTHRSEYARHQ